MENFLFIVNPIAGGGKAKELIPQIRELMGESGKEFDVILTTRPKEAIEL
ncbi:MAG TPA: diacylglycerol kinase, partial [Thermoanaerobacterales bacterium]|nr:diacylglycerol kinase [Thermoanaerobacterales bacterium]